MGLRGEGNGKAGLRIIRSDVHGISLSNKRIRYAPDSLDYIFNSSCLKSVFIYAFQNLYQNICLREILLESIIGLNYLTRLILDCGSHLTLQLMIKLLWK